MPAPRRATLVLTALAVTLGAAGCGDDDPSTSTRTTTVPLVFGDDGLRADGSLEVPATAPVTLSVAAQDGRPHGLTVEDAPKRARVVVLPGETKDLALGVLPAGRYRLAPDGAQEPLQLVVSP